MPLVLIPVTRLLICSQFTTSTSASLHLNYIAVCAQHFSLHMCECGWVCCVCQWCAKLMPYLITAKHLTQSTISIYFEDSLRVSTGLRQRAPTFLYGKRRHWNISHRRTHTHTHMWVNCGAHMYVCCQALGDMAKKCARNIAHCALFPL